MKRLSKKYISLYVLCLVLMLSCIGFGCFAEGECVHADTVTVLMQEPDCNSVGYTEGVYCNDCDSFISGHEEIPSSHKEVPFRRVEPTCVEVGYTEGVYCTACESFVSGHEEIPLADHTRENREGTEPTCNEVGYTEGVFCVVCESWLSGHVELPASHKQAILPKEPETCTENGYTEGVYCTVCEELLSGREVIPAGHREVFVEQEPANCTGNGYTAGMYCTVCNMYTSGHIEIPFTDHSFTEKIIDSRHLVQQATAESPAIYRYDCATCTAISPDLTFFYGSRLPVGVTSQVKATQSASAVRLQWNAVPGADGYRVYYRAAKGWIPYKDVTETTFIFTGLKSGTVYIFAVRAYHINDGIITLSHDYTTVETSTKTDAPAKIAAKQNLNAIKLMWTPVRNATGYRIYYRTAGTAWKVCVRSTVDTYYIFNGLPSGKTYQFAVRPYIVTSSSFVLGNYATFITSTIPGTPSVAVKSPAPRHASLSWSAVSGADGYQVFYRIGNGSVKFYKAYTSVQSLMFPGLTSGSKVTFAVRAVKKTQSGYIYGAYKAGAVQIR